ncbi:uncharacterized protein RSE6_01531 [Rhynchosporium secalis]|uniref:Uncharacterized protein n=1 Tax=Rhynchosporium secalis TaxID=38038 RepID=A0A1E1LY09_RHYSE|nr:uncharacterized protein RSE6_01531 [Rhynchosporium secalis]
MARACSTCAIGEVEKQVSQLPSLPHLQEFSCTTASSFHIFDWPSKPTSQGWSSDSQYKASVYRDTYLFSSAHVDLPSHWYEERPQNLPHLAYPMSTAHL